MRPSAPYSNELLNGIAVVGSIRQKQAVQSQYMKDVCRKTAVMVLSGAEGKADRQSLAIDEGMDLCR